MAAKRLAWQYDARQNDYADTTGRFVIRLDPWSATPDVWALYDLGTTLYYQVRTVAEAKRLARHLHAEEVIES